MVLFLGCRFLYFWDDYLLAYLLTFEILGSDDYFWEFLFGWYCKFLDRAFLFRWQWVFIKYTPASSLEIILPSIKSSKKQMTKVLQEEPSWPSSDLLQNALAWQGMSRENWFDEESGGPGGRDFSWLLGGDLRLRFSFLLDLQKDAPWVYSESWQAKGKERNKLENREKGAKQWRTRAVEGDPGFFLVW